MTSSIKRARNQHRRHGSGPNSDQDQSTHNLLFDEQWEELVIRFDSERGDFTVHTAKEAETAELHKSAGNRLG